MRIVAPPFDSTSHIAGKPHAGENRSERKAETIAELQRIVAVGDIDVGGTRS